MKRYLGRVRRASPGAMLRVGPSPRARRFLLDYATWHARPAGGNGPISSAPAEPGSIDRADPERRQTSRNAPGQRAA
jgi:hypothetical protein